MITIYNMKFKCINCVNQYKYLTLYSYNLITFLYTILVILNETEYCDMHNCVCNMVWSYISKYLAISRNNTRARSKFILYMRTIKSIRSDILWYERFFFDSYILKSSLCFCHLVGCIYFNCTNDTQECIHSSVYVISRGYMNPPLWHRACVHKLQGRSGSAVYILASVNNQQSAVAAAMAAVTNCTCTHTN